jgi:hypothetical protein
MRHRHSFIDDIIAFEEYMERKEELKARKKKDEPKKGEVRRLSFAEGMIVAFMLQFVAGPLYNHWIATLGVH